MASLRERDQASGYKGTINSIRSHFLFLCSNLVHFVEKKVKMNSYFSPSSFKEKKEFLCVFLPRSVRKKKEGKKERIKE